MKIIESMWEQFAAQSLDAPTPEDLESAKVVFYAGVAAMIRVQNVVGDERFSEAQAIETFQNIDSELFEFYQDRLNDEPRIYVPGESGSA